jgi:hypothetical protein
MPKRIRKKNNNSTLKTQKGCNLYNTAPPWAQKQFMIMHGVISPGSYLRKDVLNSHSTLPTANQLLTLNGCTLPPVNLPRWRLTQTQALGKEYNCVTFLQKIKEKAVAESAIVKQQQVKRAIAGDTCT